MLGLSRKKLLNGFLAIGLSFVLLYLAFRKVSFETTLRLLNDVELSYVWSCILLLCLIQLIRAYRWGILVRPFADISWLGIFRISNLGIALVLLLPFRLGEFARPYLLKAEANAPMSSGFGASAVERTIDGLVIVFLYFLTTTNLPEHYSIHPYLKYSSLVAGAIFGTALVVILLALFYHDFVVRLLERAGSRISPRLTRLCINLLNGFVDGLKSLPNTYSLIALLVSTGIYFILSALTFYVVFLAFGWDLPIMSSFLLMCVVVLGIMVPAGPGFLGTYQAAITLGLSIFGIDATEAAAFGLIIYPLNLLVVISFGLPFLIGAQRLSLREMFEAPQSSIQRK